MISLQVFMLGVLVTSTLTGLTTEAIKKILTEYGKNCPANTLAGIVSLVLSVGIGTGYMLMSDVGFTSQTFVYLVSLVFISWLCAMVGYDKVIQTISQFKMTDTEKS